MNPEMLLITKDDFTESKQILYADVEREIWLAQTSTDSRGQALKKLGIPSLGGANFLSALGLLCFTEYCGWLRYDRRNGKRALSSGNFNSFFDSLGKDYAVFRKKNDVYGIFRCGMVHQYYAKRPFEIVMPTEIDGVAITRDIIYHFYVASYFRDLKNRLQSFEQEIKFPVSRPAR
jgi:hypothetical protein